MKYFLLPDKDKNTGNDFKIVKVQQQDVDSFLVRHGQEVILEGNSISEVLMGFSQKVDLTRNT